ncbi:hypothetical protein T03_427 [Trichinella britovi]|uniref:Uncharacterized protein n=1 Tax=Trichinella britovi TaxID=45882 RepID=A0A0V1C3A4_TRIBR|nr:hypothetical protein T03_427 [Trichinella britovi]
MDGKQLLIPLWYNLESTIHAPGLHGCQQSNVGTRRNYQYMFRFTSSKFLIARNTFRTYRCNSLSQEGLVQLTTAVNSPRRSTHHGGQLAAWSTHRDYLCLWHSLKS